MARFVVELVDQLGSVDIGHKKLIFIFQLDNLNHDIFKHNCGRDGRICKPIMLL
jgi:hypothetical protein